MLSSYTTQYYLFYTHFPWKPSQHIHIIFCDMFFVYFVFFHFLIFIKIIYFVDFFMKCTFWDSGGGGDGCVGWMLGYPHTLFSPRGQTRTASAKLQTIMSTQLIHRFALERTDKLVKRWLGVCVCVWLVDDCWTMDAGQVGWVECGWGGVDVCGHLRQLNFAESGQEC